MTQIEGLATQRGNVSSANKAFPTLAHLEECAGDRRRTQQLTSAVVEAFPRRPEGLLADLLAIEWCRREAPLRDAYLAVLFAVATAYPCTIQAIIGALVALLLLPDGRAEGCREGGSACEALLAILRLIPSAGPLILATVEYYFPFHRQSVAVHESYSRNLLHLARHEATLQNAIVALLLRKALVLDVEVQECADGAGVDDGIDSDDEGDEEEPAEACIIDDDDGDAVEGSAAQALPSERRRRRDVREYLAKLDTILARLLVHIEERLPCRHDGGKAGLRAAREAEGLFACLLTVFETSILVTFKARFVQAVLFYACALDPRRCDALLGILFRPLVAFCHGVEGGRAASAATTSVLLSVAYIGSFVARSAFVPGGLLQMAFEMLLRLARQLVERTAIGGPSSLTVAALTHVMAIFTARHGDLVPCIGLEALEDLFEDVFQEGRLLAHCDGATVSAFVAVASVTYDIVDADLCAVKRGGGGEDPLDAYAPFAPITAALPQTLARLNSRPVYLPTATAATAGSGAAALSFEGIR